MVPMAMMLVSRGKKRKDKESEPWQEKVLKFLEPVDVAPVAPPPKKDYIDVALEAISVQCKENLNKNEILDVVDDIQQLVSRVCRDKRRREQLQRNPTTTSSCRRISTRSTGSHGSATNGVQQ